MGQWLLSWLPTKKRIKRNTYRSYESHIRLYLVPYLGQVRLDKLRVVHVADMFDAIAEHNEEIRAARASKDQARRKAVRRVSVRWARCRCSGSGKPCAWR